MEEFVIKDYKEFLEENELENTIKNIDNYIAGLYYDILDNLDIEREEFSVPKDLIWYSAIEYIEEQIKNILLKGIK